jgi:glutamyl-tRNA synthetase
MGKVIAERQDLKIKIKEVIPIIKKITREVNSLSISEQRTYIEEKWPALLIKEKAKPEIKKLPPLPNVENYSVVHVRFCPNPDGSLHLGGSRAAILCDEYAEMYSGHFTLRFDDSDPRTKAPILDAYNWIREDLRWLDIKWHKEIYQSDRLDLYYHYTNLLIEMGKAYVCSCNPQKFKRLLLSGQSCPCRNLNSKDHLERWNQMLNGSYREGQAVVRIKTDLNHPNPAVRDWPALRIIDVNKFPHPRTGDKYRVWPLFAFCSGVDDHDLEISHMLRGKEHLTNSTRQHFLYTYLGWNYPEAIHYGRFKMAGTVLSKSKIREGIDNNTYCGWDDPRLGTLRALRRRGFRPETIRQLILEVGPKAVDVTVSWKNLQAYNRKIVEHIANRYSFVSNPVQLMVKNINRPYICKQPLHPSYHERGYKAITITPVDDKAFFFISNNDIKFFKKCKIVRLMGLFNVTGIKVDEIIEAAFHSESYQEAKSIKAPLIHWLPSTTGVKTAVIMPDASIVKGLSENDCRNLNEGDIIQFERFGFVRVDSVVDKLITYYAHR